MSRRSLRRAVAFGIVAGLAMGLDLKGLSTMAGAIIIKEMLL